MTKRMFVIPALLAFALGCRPTAPLDQFADHYRQHGDFYSLNQVVELLPPGSDTADVRHLLGEPIDFGFDYRYLVDSVGENNCAVGAVFHIDDGGMIDQRWTGEICE